MALQVTEMSPTRTFPIYPVRLTSPPLSLPSTNAEAKEMAEVAIKYGLASVAFGVILLLVLQPRA